MKPNRCANDQNYIRFEVKRPFFGRFVLEHHLIKNKIVIGLSYIILIGMASGLTNETPVEAAGASESGTNEPVVASAETVTVPTNAAVAAVVPVAGSLAMNAGSPNRENPARARETLIQKIEQSAVSAAVPVMVADATPKEAPHTNEVPATVVPVITKTTVPILTPTRIVAASEGSHQVRANVSRPTPPAIAKPANQIVTINGEVFDDVRVLRVEADGMYISYQPPQGGMAVTKVYLNELSDTLRQKYGFSTASR